jgi:coenzyme A diphosphatase NUDT7
MQIREANEEISLPINSPHIQTLGTLPLLPFHSLIVTPIVALLTDNTVIDKLKPGEGEVDHIFSYPLEAILEPSLAPGFDTLVEHGGHYWPYEARYHVTKIFLFCRYPLADLLFYWTR